MFDHARPALPAGHVRILSVQSMLDPWTGEARVAVLFEGRVEGGCVVMLTEERCAELRLREALRSGAPVSVPKWRD